MLVKVIEKYHIRPRELNDSLSSVIFNNVISLLDPQERIFTEKDIQTLEPFRYSIQAELTNGKCSFLQALTKIYRNNLLWVDSITNDILSKPFDFTQKDSITFTNSRKVQFAKDPQALRKRWLKHFKYRALLISAQPDTTTGKVPAESEIRAKLKATAHRRNLLLINPEYGLESTVEARYLNAIATAYDPHTNYFTPEEYQSFQNATSARTETYGIIVDESEQGEIVIERILPGSSAWKGNQLHKGDVIIAYRLRAKMYWM